MRDQARILTRAAEVATVWIGAAYLKPDLLVPTRVPVKEHSHITGC